MVLTDVNWMLMGSLLDRVCWMSRNCFIWLLSPACNTSLIWNVPGSLASKVITADSSGSLTPRKIQSAMVESGGPTALALVCCEGLTPGLGLTVPVSLGQGKQELMKKAQWDSAILDASSFLFFGTQATWENCVQYRGLGSG